MKRKKAEVSIEENRKCNICKRFVYYLYDAKMENFKLYHKWCLEAFGRKIKETNYGQPND